MSDDGPTSGFQRIVDRGLSRRSFLEGGLAFGASALAVGALTGDARATPRFEFQPVAANTRDTVTLPPGFRWHVVARWGDPLWSHGPAFDPETRGTGSSQELACGDNIDGMELFDVDGRSVLCINNEYVNRGIFHGNRPFGWPWNTDDIRKSKAGHGITIAEIALRDGRWRITQDSSVNRRLTADTPIAITGPARGHPLVRTADDQAGVQALGTWNNCGCGRTPWGTYLTCEENFNGYFLSSDGAYTPTPEMRRYGIGFKDWGYAWAKADQRFDISRHPNEPNRFGYVVEIDPLDAQSMPRKRTALGRFKHENAEVVLASDGRVVVYMGDDEQGEFLYRFVSAGRYVLGGDNSGLLDEGQLYAARFNDDFSGAWLALTPAATGMGSTAEICIHTRQAASAVGATTMDRPEWVAAHPRKAEVYCALTNNSRRGAGINAGGDAMPAKGPNPRARNRYGQIVRWSPTGGDHAAAGFTWNLYVLAGNPKVHTGADAGSANVTSANMFNSPDGLAFSPGGLLWMQTDGNDSDGGDFAGMGNNQMLVGDPASGDIRRFMVGPPDCEVTGLAWSTDRRTLFCGIQHPGVRGNSHFPDGGDAVPRSSVIAITRDDGGPIG